MEIVKKWRISIKMGRNVTKHIFNLAIISSILSQFDGIESIFRPIMFAMWILALAASIVVNGGKIFVKEYTKVYILLYILYSIYCCIANLWSGEHLKSGYLSLLIVPLFIILCVDNTSGNIENCIQEFAKVFAVTGIVLAVYVQIYNIGSYTSWLNSISYVYEKKNSSAQIWSCTLFLIYFIIPQNRRIEKLFWRISFIYILIVIGLSQCRTAILGFAVVVLYYVFFRVKHKFLYLFTIVALIEFTFVYEPTRRYLFQALLFNRMNTGSINDFSSGRLTVYSKAIEQFSYSPLIGSGSWYADCSYLLILAESGLLGFLLIEPIWIIKIKENIGIKKFTYEKGRVDFVIGMTIFYIVESVFEGYPPFGPGVSTLGFWLFTTLLIKHAEVSNFET